MPIIMIHPAFCFTPRERHSCNLESIYTHSQVISYLHTLNPPNNYHLSGPSSWWREAYPHDPSHPGFPHPSPGHHYTGQHKSMAAVNMYSDHTGRKTRTHFADFSQVFSFFAVNIRLESIKKMGAAAKLSKHLYYLTTSDHLVTECLPSNVYTHQYSSQHTCSKDNFILYLY